MIKEVSIGSRFRVVSQSIGGIDAVESGNDEVEEVVVNGVWVLVMRECGCVERKGTNGQMEVHMSSLKKSSRDLGDTEAASEGASDFSPSLIG